MSNCPFCGIITEVPHETQEGCIQALHAEITRVRSLLGHVKSAEVREPAEAGETVSDEGQPEI